MKTCCKCKSVKTLDGFHKAVGNPDGHKAYCKACACAYMSAYASREEVRAREHQRHLARYALPEVRAAATERSRLRTELDPVVQEKRLVRAAARETAPERARAKRAAQFKTTNGTIAKKARSAAAFAVIAGRIQTGPCAHADGACSEQLNAHHWSYQREHWLDVTWLCTKHHKREHDRLKREGTDQFAFLSDIAAA